MLTACRLCLTNTDLKISHIIPEAFYNGVYDSKHRALPISLEDNKLRFKQQGFKEKLLCTSCEEKFSKWESTIAKDVVDFGKQKSEFLKFTTLHEKIIKVENIRYKEFKLGILSILWRLSISSDPFFSSYNLGAYEEKLRKILLDEALVDEKMYPFRVSRYELNGVFYPNILMGFPSLKYSPKITVQTFIIWGHCFIIFVNDRYFPELPIDIFLRNSGELYIDIGNLAELASSRSVLKRIYDEDVSRMFARMKK